MWPLRGFGAGHLAELELQRQLNQLWRLRRQNLVEGWRTDVAVGKAEILVVQEVKELSAQLKFLPSATVMFLNAEKSQSA